MSELKRFANISWDAEYMAIGRFVVAFERLMQALRFNCSCLFQLAGLSEWKMSEALLSAPQLSPETLAIQFASSVAALQPERSDLAAKGDALVKAVKSLSEKRNAIIHGEWMIGDDVVIVTDQNTVGTVHGIRRKPSKSGVSVNELPTAAEIEALASECLSTAKLVQEVFSQVVRAKYQSRVEVTPQSDPSSP